MADQMKPTPRSTILGLFSDVVNLPLEYMSSPERTQQMQGAAQFLYGTGIPKTLERMSYGDSLFTGSGMTLRPREETINAAMNVAPFVPAVGRVVGRAVRATEGLPVGMSIKDVGKTGLPSPQSLTMPSVPTVDQMKKYGRTEVVPLSKAVSFQSARNWEKFNAKKGAGDLVAGYGDKPLALRLETGEYVIYDGNHRTDLALQKGQTELPMHVIDVKSYDPAHAGRKPVPPSMTDDELLNSLLGDGVNTPQQAALDLAQQRAALPIEQGGLGLPANNTPEMRAAAMGFDVDAYHGTASKDIQKFMPEGGTPEGEKTLEWYKNRQAQNEPVGYMAFRGGSFFSPKPEYAGSYAPEGTGVVYPVKLRMDNPLSLLPNAQGRYSATNAPDINKTIDAMILQDSIDRSINEIAIIDPAQIRSRFAAFDPFRRDVATATAMGVAAPDLLAQTIDQYQIPQETTPMYTDPFGNTIGSSIR